MRSVLGSIFSKLYMSTLDNKIFKSKSSIYLQCIDDVLIPANNNEEIQKNFMYKFTLQLNANNEIPDVLIDTSNNTLNTPNYQKHN